MVVCDLPFMKAQKYHIFHEFYKMIFMLLYTATQNYEYVFLHILYMYKPHNVWLKSTSVHVSFESHVKQLHRVEVQTGV